MNCYIVSLGCAIDDLIVGVVATKQQAAALAKNIARDPGPFLKEANAQYGRDASEILVVNTVKVRGG